MARDPIPDELEDDAAAEDAPHSPKHPPPEDELGGGDICSPEESPATEDDAPLP